MLNKYDQEVAEVLDSLWAKGIKTLNWSANPASLSEPWVESWVDVYVREVCDLMDLNWIATIISPDSEDQEGSGCFKIKHDSELVFLFEDQDQLAATKNFFIGPKGDQIELGIDPAEGDSGEFYWGRYRSEFFIDHGAEILTSRVPVWSTDLIESTISDWLEKISGHKFALIFDPDIEPGIFEEVRQAAENIASGRAETFDLGDGLFASSQVLDTFLEDPDMAAKITAELKENVIKKDE